MAVASSGTVETASLVISVTLAASLDVATLLRGAHPGPSVAVAAAASARVALIVPSR